jgi:protein-disulfide isomerase/uncharacterized membrane protein/peroxiredoxin
VIVPEQVAKGWALKLLWLLLLPAAGVALYLGYAHIRLAHGSGSFESLCAVSELLNCDAVNTSRYSEFFGIPTSFFALPVYLAMLMLVDRGLQDSPQGRSARRGLFSLALMNVGVSAYLAWESAMILQAWCMFCVSLYVVHVLVLFLVMIPLGARIPGLPAGRDLALVLASGLATFGALALGALFMGAQLDEVAIQELGLATRSSSTLITEQRAGGKVKLPDAVAEISVAAHNPSVGPEDAAVTLVEFADFECGHCRKLRSTLALLKDKYKDRVRFVFKHYPMDRECNPNMKRTHHRFACEAAVASQCAERQGSFWPFHDLLFKNQKAMEPEDLVRYAEILEMDIPAFSLCLNDDSVKQEVLADISMGGELELSGTPRTYVNGRQFRGAVSRAILDAAIRVELGEVQVDAEGKVETRQEFAVGEPLAAGPVDMAQINVGGLSFWIDRVEASLAAGGRALSQAGVEPASANWFEAVKACEAADKRICSQEEWLAACVGSRPEDMDGDGSFVGETLEGRLYPYGDHYMRGVCWDAGDSEKNKPLATGRRGACRSPEGVYDLTGNIQEWAGTTSEQAVLLGGGWFARDKSSCGMAGTRFGPGYENRNTGFRCCADAAPGTVAAAESLAPKTHGVQVGEELPIFDGEDLGGIGVSTEHIMGKVGLINFWASWCAPCQRELPFLARMQEEYGPKGFQVISVNVDRIPDKARPWIARFDLPFPVMMDPDAEVMGLFDVMAMPTSVLVDMDGKVLEVHTGFSDAWAKSLRIRLAEMLE